MNSLQLSRRAEQAPASPIRKLTPYADQAKKEGVKVYHLNIGQPDFSLPEKIKKELQNVVAETNLLPYVDSRGIPQMITAWQNYYRQIGLSLDPTDILITTGGSEAIILALAAVADPGDEILAFEPAYANYAGYTNLLGLKIKAVSLDEKNNFHLPQEKNILRAIGPKTKAILITSPNNPTGTVLTKKEVGLILDLAEKNHLFIIADETYRGLVFDHLPNPGFLEIATPVQIPHVIIVDSLSKRLNICGARLGAVICRNQAVNNALLRFAQTRLSVAALEQTIASPMLNDCLPYVAQITTEYQNRRNALLKVLQTNPQIKTQSPEGAFYLFLTLPVKDAEDFARWLLTDFRENNSTVMVAPGNGFYFTPGRGESQVRLAYVLKEAELEKAARIFLNGLTAYQKR